VADEVDLANDLVQRRVDEGVARAQEKPLPPGVAGHCEPCGEFFQRLVLTREGLACAGCRDRYRL
jgi:hypothetical protein